MKRARRRFSVEPGNLTHEHTFKASGLCNAKAVNLSAAVTLTEKFKADEKNVEWVLEQADGVSFGVRSSEASNPSGLFTREEVENKHNRDAVERKKIVAALDGGSYRRDLTKAAI